MLYFDSIRFIGYPVAFGLKLDNYKDQISARVICPHCGTQHKDPFYIGDNISVYCPVCGKDTLYVCYSSQQKTAPNIALAPKGGIHNIWFNFFIRDQLDMYFTSVINFIGKYAALPLSDESIEEILNKTYQYFHITNTEENKQILGTYINNLEKAETYDLGILKKYGTYLTNCKYKLIYNPREERSCIIITLKHADFMVFIHNMTLNLKGSNNFNFGDYNTCEICKRPRLSQNITCCA
ncbi:hypothetical protein COV24_02240 [candidate division WWE3 bacterium CG10_big_fil_rev_8_21_14_0_10_32_10]|uniref:Uncharacterized protein n=1 Tax=candidate division WWE3 bacterium CG10_big_fil_rev_8_21_14_0_10_32_10 TaxID=1975090 RepID=A0A2H0RCJ7_UNCKA|nr:MAG: hypothetical protein COV24_02240 [candidate division WWE3 bacterium CG10_big_fil_rev_8_21_14_0_10_32_10]